MKKTSTLRGDSYLEGNFDLQLFASEGSKDDSKDDKKDEPKAYTQEELDKLLQSEGDKRVSEALNTARAKWKAEYEEKLEKEKKEAERLASLSAKEKEEEILRQKERELADKEAAIKLRELQLDTINVLVEEKLPVGFADFLIKDDAETTKGNIKKFKEEWQKAVAVAVDEKISGTSPKLPESQVENKSIADFMKLATEASIRK